jgi:hypothetical protein
VRGRLPKFLVGLVTGEPWEEEEEEI